VGELVRRVRLRLTGVPIQGNLQHRDESHWEEE